MGISKVEYDNEILMDVSNDTITEDDLAEGVTAHNSNGDQIEGTFPMGEVDTQAELIEQIALTLQGKAAPSGGSGGGESVEEVAVVTCDVNMSNMQVSNISHTYEEICTLAQEKKYVAIKCNVLGVAVVYGPLVIINESSNMAIFQVMMQTDFGDGLKLYYFSVITRLNGSTSINPYIINTTTR